MTIMAHCHMQQLAGDHLWSLPQQGLDRVFNGGISDGLAMLLLNLLPKGLELVEFTTLMFILPANTYASREVQQEV
jgi:hypothetical protein